MEIRELGKELSSSGNKKVGRRRGELTVKKWSNNGDQVKIFKLLKSPGIYSKESNFARLQYVAQRAGTTTLFLLGS